MRRPSLHAALSDFNPRSPCGERLNVSQNDFRTAMISIHAPRAGSDLCAALHCTQLFQISIHAPRAGSDSPIWRTLYTKKLFQSTLPVRGATLLIVIFATTLFTFQSTLPVRGATRRTAIIENKTVISIHAPRAGSDHRGRLRRPLPVGISIHAPRAGSDFSNPKIKSIAPLFQSTLPVRGATRVGVMIFVPVYTFQSTLPVRGATAEQELNHAMNNISIHAPRAGSDK